MSTEIIRPVRSMSYNDIKKRRMLRQSKSNSKIKLKNSQASTQIVHTEKKVYHGNINSNNNQLQGSKNPAVDLYASQRPNQIEHIQYAIAGPSGHHWGPKQQLYQQQLQEEYTQTVKRQVYNNFTDRMPYNSHSSQIKPVNRNIGDHQQSKSIEKPIRTQESRQRHRQGIMAGHSREIVKDLIQQSKSERKLLRYNELRNKFKLSKSREKSRSAQSLLSKQKMLPKKLISVNITPQKPSDDQLKGIKHSIRVKRFQSLNQGNYDDNNNANLMNIKSRIQSTTANYNSNIVDNVHKTSNSNINKKGNFRYLVSAPSIPKDSKVAINNSNMGMNKGREVTNLLQDQIESSIQMQKQSSMFDSQEDHVLQQMLRIKREKHKDVNKSRKQKGNNSNKQIMADNWDQILRDKHMKQSQFKNSNKSRSRSGKKSKGKGHNKNKKKKNASGSDSIVILTPNIHMNVPVHVPQSMPDKSKYSTIDQNDMQDKYLSGNAQGRNMIKNKNGSYSRHKDKDEDDGKSSENILDLLDIQPQQISKAINKKQRQKKILHDLQKLNRKFPKGFFKF